MNTDRRPRWAGWLPVQALRQREVWGAAASFGVILLAVFLFYSPSDGDDALAEGDGGRALRAGDPAPPFAVQTIAGGIFNLDAERGQPIWINVWASWCPPCRAEMPDIYDIQRQAKASGLRFIAINDGEGPDAITAYLANTGYDFEVGVDSTSAFARLYRILGLPGHIFIDASGDIHAIRVGTMTREEMVATTESLLGAVASAPSRSAPALAGNDPRFGEALYNAQCLACHGGPAGDVRVAGAPPHTNDGHTWHHGDGTLVAAVLDGGTQMPGFRGRLTEDEVVAVLDYVKSWWGEAQRESQRAATAAGH